MNHLKEILLQTMTVAAAIFILAGFAYSEQIQGKLKSLNENAKVFTIESGQGKVLFIIYNKSTHWKNVKSSDELEQDDFLNIELNRKGDLATAVSITKAVTTIPSGFTSITTEKLAEHLDLSVNDLPFTLIDTRPLEDFDAAHLPHAVSIPLSRLKKQAAVLLPANNNTHLIFYDQGAGGTEALYSAELAKIIGYPNISIYPDGVTGWVKSGRVAASSTAFIRKIKPGLIDLRDEEIVAGGHLSGAVNIPVKKLPGMLGIFPMNKRVPIVLYGESNQQVVNAARIVREWGYRNVTIYMGGTAAWINSAEVLSTEPTEKYIAAPGPSHSGQLGAKDFEKALNSSAIIEIVDVRSSTDFKNGSFPSSKHIPLQELPQRHKELSKDKIQVVFGSDEQHAEMAFDFLRPLGYRVNYLKGSVDFSNGQYQVK